jgi:adenylate cyclase
MEIPYCMPAALRRSRKVVMVIDLVESVRLMEIDEAAVVAEWRDFVRECTQQIIPAHRGRLVKSLGDGLMVEFEIAQDAVCAAQEMHAAMDHRRLPLHAEAPMRLRSGLHSSEVYADGLDIYGAGVNLAARLATLAGPGETVISAAVRDSLTDGLDGVLEDLGECHLKHVAEPVRAFRVGAGGHTASVPGITAYDAKLRPTIAVTPFHPYDIESLPEGIGQLIAEGLIARLSHANHRWHVISRLSSLALSGRNLPLATLNRCLGAHYVVSGGFAGVGHQLMIFYELADARSNDVVLAGRVEGGLADLLEASSDVLDEMSASVQAAILDCELQRVRTRPLPTLESYTLLLGGIQLLHRSSWRDFARSREVLEHLIGLHPRVMEPRIWLAKWFALRAVQEQQQGDDLLDDSRVALACTRGALEEEPDNAFALAVEGFVHCHLTKDYAQATERLDRAVDINPSEAMAHTFQAVVRGLTGDFEGGIASYQRAVVSSPLDPTRYLMDSIGAYVHLGAGRLPDAIRLAKESLRQNCHHAHTWRTLAIAQVEAGELEQGCASVAKVLALEPDLTIKRYLGSAKPNDPARHRFAEALAAAGVPSA